MIIYNRPSDNSSSSVFAATQNEVNSGVNNTAYVTPLNLRNVSNVPISGALYASPFYISFQDYLQRSNLFLTGNCIFTGENYGDQKSYQLFLAADGVTRTVSFPSGWVFVGTKPINLIANKKAVFSLECTHPNETGVFCAWAYQE
jgi:hypothetical protein